MQIIIALNLVIKCRKYKQLRDFFKGMISNSINKESIAFVAIGVEGTTQGGTSDDNGNYTVSFRATTSFLKAKAIPDQTFSSLLRDPRYSLAIPMG